MTTAVFEAFLIRRLRWLAAVHLVCLAALVLVVVIARRCLVTLPMGTLVLVLALMGGFYLAQLAYALSRDEADVAPVTRNGLLWALVLVDIAGFSMLLHLAGGSENPFFPFYVFPVVLAGTMLPPPAGLIAAGISTALYGGLLWGERMQWLRHYPLGLHQDPLVHQLAPFLLSELLATAALCFLAGAITSILVAALRARAGELADSKHCMEGRSEQLLMANEQLEAIYQESRHSQEHLRDLYTELGDAYNRLDNRAQHMSELNERLRAANAECKGGREELAAVNAQLQEANQRLEARSLHMKELNDQLRAANEECRSRRDELTEVNARLARANNRLREQDDTRAQFTLLVTHELRAPVAAIQSYLKLILEGYVPADKVSEILEKAEHRAMEQLALISDLLELGRIQSSNVRGQALPVQIEEVLREQLDLLSASAGERGIAIETRIAANIPPVLATRDQMSSVWNNLISNAIKYNQDGGRVSVVLDREGERVTGSVGDTGIGIPPSAMARLFSEFFRADNAKAASRMGTGLGLAIVKEIIERSGGRITVESALDEGTIFHFWLPAAQEAAASPDGARKLPTG